MPTIGGIDHANRAKLEVLHRKAAGPFGAAQAAAWLGLSRSSAQRLLAYLAARGWLVRVRQGLYVPVPLDARQPGEWTEDPWVVAQRLFDPCFIAGWSACEHWGLTEQLFRQVVVVTGRRVRHRRIEVQGTPFRVKVLPPAKHFGTRTVWRGQVAVQVSDPSRTVVDLLDDPSLAGGFRMVREIVEEYFTSSHRSDADLIGYAERLGNRSVFKRLGFLVELIGLDAAELVEACHARLSQGVSKLDPSAPAAGPVDRRWRVRLNNSVAREGAG